MPVIVIVPSFLNGGSLYQRRVKCYISTCNPNLRLPLGDNVTVFAVDGRQKLQKGKILNSTIFRFFPRLSISFRYIWHRVRTELASEVNRFYLSYLWWIIEPCLFIGVFYVVFGMLFDRGGEGFVSFLVLGVTAWFWFAHTVARATLSIRRELGLMRQVYVSKYVFPFSAVLFGVFKHFFVLIVLMGLLVYANDPAITWLYFFLLLLVQLLLILAVSTIVAAIVPFVPEWT